MSERNKQLVRELCDCVNSGAFDTATSLFDENVAYHGSGGDEQRGPTDSVTGKVYKVAFPDLKLEQLQVVADDECAAALVRGTGTFTGELMGMPATGNPFDLTWMFLVRVRNGKIVEKWEIYDTADFMGQLGVGS